MERDEERLPCTIDREEAPPPVPPTRIHLHTRKENWMCERLTEFTDKVVVGKMIKVMLSLFHNSSELGFIQERKTGCGTRLPKNTNRVVVGRKETKVAKIYSSWTVDGGGDLEYMDDDGGGI
ncbi:hypothetical protein Lser_V15G06459 [Lactuca serriola]